MSRAEVVTAWIRTAAWTVSFVIGVSVYVVCSALFAAVPAREKADVRRQIEAVLAETRRQPACAAARAQTGGQGSESEEDGMHALAEGRAALSLLGALQKREAELTREQKSRRIWALLAAFVASGGCFALCTARWWSESLGRRISPAPEGSASP